MLNSVRDRGLSVALRLRAWRKALRMSNHCWSLTHPAKILPAMLFPVPVTRQGTHIEFAQTNL